VFGGVVLVVGLRVLVLLLGVIGVVLSIRKKIRR